MVSREFTAALRPLRDCPPLDRPFLDQLAKDGALELSVAKSSVGKALAHHVYYCSSKRSCLLHAASLYQLVSDSAARNAMGRANRYLFWHDIIRYKEQGLKLFDFGGWYPGTTDNMRLEINRFKEGFGGRVVREYNCEQITSVRGWLLLTVASWLNHFRRRTAKPLFSPNSRKPETPPAAAEVSSGHPSTMIETLASENTRLAQ